jgi:hypothetical protein
MLWVELQVAYWIFDWDNSENSDSLRSWSAKYVCKSLIEKFEEEMETEREEIIHSQSTLRVKNCLNA